VEPWLREWSDSWASDEVGPAKAIEGIEIREDLVVLNRSAQYIDPFRDARAGIDSSERVEREEQGLGMVYESMELVEDCFSICLDGLGPGGRVGIVGLGGA
jgi:hypothetical protein